MGGIRSEIRIDAPTECPIAKVSRDTDASCHSISKSVDPDATGRMTEEFVLEGGAAVEHATLETDVTRVFSYGSSDVYRFSRSVDTRCPCVCIEQFDCPLVDVYTRNGALHLVFHAPDVETLQDVVASLREQHPKLSVERLFRSRTETDEPDLVVLDRSDLTDRQREVLRRAHELGYFEHPKDANAGEVADALGITTSTFTEHLAAAQRKLLDAVVDEPT